jgi:subtilase family serine protease
MLSAAGIATPQLIALRPAESGVNTTVVGDTPSQIRSAYGFDQVSFTNALGRTVAANGAGQTIAIVDAYNDPNILADANTFSRQFNLPQFNTAGGPVLTVTSQTGSTSALPATDAGWSEEIALDVEWAHAIAPGANILLVEANSDNFPDLLLAVNHAKVQPAVSVISMSWGGDEFIGETTWDSAFVARRGHIGQTFVAAAGDDGSPPEWPAVSPWVLSVGGTTLNVNIDNSYGGETGWSGTSGGISSIEWEPAFQYHVQSTGWRSGPDVAYNGDPETGMAVYDSVPLDGQSGWAAIGGTSAGTPQWAALIAIANQGRALKGLGTLSNAQQIMYTLPATDFHDITSGNDGGYSAGPGYDGVTGLGSPLANLVIQNLVNGVSPGSTPPESSNTGIMLQAKFRAALTTSPTNERAAVANPSFEIQAAAPSSNLKSEISNSSALAYAPVIPTSHSPLTMLTTFASADYATTSVNVADGEVDSPTPIDPTLSPSSFHLSPFSRL